MSGTMRRLWEHAVRTSIRRSFDLWQAVGVHVTPNHYFEPVPDTRRLAPQLWERTSELPGLRIELEPQVELARTLAARFGDEWAFPERPAATPWQFHFGNGAFETVDAEMLYGLVRLRRPRRVVEIGSGHSSYVIAQAARRNAAEGAPCTYEAIEPYPNDVLRGGVPGLTRLRPVELQSIPLEDLTRLGEGDLLFIDSTHVLRIGSDVQYEYLELLPRLRPGVLVHVHDIFLPAEYPREWVLRERRFWNEQYLLQAFLAFNDAFRIVWAGSFMHLRHPDVLRELFPSYAARGGWPGSFWFERVR